MYLEKLVSPFWAILSEPKCFYRRIVNSKLVSFGLMANISALNKRGLFSDIDLVIDVGSNIGQYAFMLKSIKPSLTIYSFEPDPNNFVKLNNNFLKYKIKGKCFKLAISNYIGKAKFNVYDNSENNSILPRIDYELAGGKEIEVTCTTLDNLVEEFSLFNKIFLKLDIQGFELNALRGAIRLLRKCKYVHLEISFKHAYTGNSHGADIFIFMRDNGFRCLDILDTLTVSKKHGFGIKEVDFLFVNENFE